ncbi:hypothetical protein [Streptomyces sp. NPDC002564]|uniref:hypothetical protein n=1 Tax=Streptomyces sp. NPDC002564 TaxID=3364649 RepID=UPI00367F22D2
MFTTHRRASARKRAIAPALVAASALVSGILLTGCSGDSKAASSDDGGDPSASPTSPFDQGLAYSKCMRENGAGDYPDPQQDTGGVRLTPGKGVDVDSESYKKAEEACRDKAPQGLGGGGGGAALDSKKVADWAKCLRTNGLPKFPDPEIEGSNMKIDINGTGITPGNADFTKAMGTCQSKYPGGGMMMNNGQGGGVPQ